MADVVAMRWQGHCYRCGKERGVESRPDHAMQALCDECAAKPHEKPKAPPERTPRQRGTKRIVTSTPMLGAHYVPVHWLWRQYIALGKITILAGLAGQGKSQLTCLVAAMTSRGMLDMPAGDVLMVSAEDDPKDTIFPRLGAANADPQRLHVLDMREHYEDGTVVPTTLEMPDDTRGLRDQLGRLNAPRLLVLDPVQAFLGGGIDSYRGASVRRALAPLKALAEDFAVAVLLVTHLNKSKEADPLARITDSGAYTALARGVLLMAPDPEDEEGDRGPHKVMALAKSNLASTGEHSLRFQIRKVQATDDHGETVEVGMLDLLGRSPLSAHDLLIPAADRPALDEARIFLRAELSEGWRKATEVQKEAKGAHSEMTLRRAREMECAKPRRAVDDTGKAAWWWGLKDDPWPGNGQGAPHARVDAMDERLEHLAGQGAQDDHMFNPPARAREDETSLLRWRDAMLGERWDDE